MCCLDAGSLHDTFLRSKRFCSITSRAPVMRTVAVLLLCLQLLLSGCKSNSVSPEAFESSTTQDVVAAHSTSPAKKQSAVSEFHYGVSMSRRMDRDAKGEPVHEIFVGEVNVTEQMRTSHGDNHRSILEIDFKVKAGEIFDYKLVTTQPIEVVEVKVQTPKQESLPASVMIKVTREGKELVSFASQVNHGEVFNIHHSSRTPPAD